MKQIFVFLFLILSQFTFTQHYKFNRNNEIVKSGFFNKQEVRIIGLFTASIILNGIGDGLNDNKNKGLGHLCNAMSAGCLLVSPFLVKAEKKKVILYVLSYTFIRYGIFDATYNITRGLSYDYIGNSAYTDIAISKIDKRIITTSKLISLSIGIYIPIKYF